MRVTVDLDYPSRLQVMKSYFNMKAFGEVEASRSAGGKGYHFVIYGLPISFKGSLRLRRCFGDDLARIGFDEKQTMKPKQVLYTRKEGVSIEKIQEADLLMAPWSSCMTAGGIKNRKGNKR